MVWAFFLQLLACIIIGTCYNKDDGSEAAKETKTMNSNTPTLQEAALDRDLTTEAWTAIHRAASNGSDRAHTLLKAMESINDSVTADDYEAAHSMMVAALESFGLTVEVR